MCYVVCVYVYVCVCVCGVCVCVVCVCVCTVCCKGGENGCYFQGCPITETSVPERCPVKYV